MVQEWGWGVLAASTPVRKNTAVPMAVPAWPHSKAAASGTDFSSEFSSSLPHRYSSSAVAAVHAGHGTYRTPMQQSCSLFNYWSISQKSALCRLSLTSNPGPPLYLGLLLMESLHPLSRAATRWSALWWGQNTASPTGWWSALVPVSPLPTPASVGALSLAADSSVPTAK